MDRIAVLHHMLEHDTDDPFTLFALGFEHQKQGNLEDALHWYEAVRTAAPDYTGVYYHLGELLQQRGCIAEAVTAYKDGIQVCRRVRATKDLAELQQALMEVDHG